MLRATISVLLLASALFCGALQAGNPPAVSVNDMKSQIENYIKNNVAVNSDETMAIVVQTNQLSQTLRCAKPLEVNFPKDSNREKITSVQLSCPDAAAWNIFVPVVVQIQTKVLVAKHIIPAKQSITEDDVDFTYQDENQLYLGFFKDVNQVIGQEAAQVIQAGTVLTPKNTQSPILVRRGQTIELFAEYGSILVSMRGVAQSDGRLNTMIKATNPTSKRLIDAIVVGESKAKVVS